MKSIENKSMAYSKSIDTENRASIKCVTRTTLYQLVNLISFTRDVYTNTFTPIYWYICPAFP